MRKTRSVLAGRARRKRPSLRTTRRTRKVDQEGQNQQKHDAFPS